MSAALLLPSPAAPLICEKQPACRTAAASWRSGGVVVLGHRSSLRPLRLSTEKFFFAAAAGGASNKSMMKWREEESSRRWSSSTAASASSSSPSSSSERRRRRMRWRIWSRFNNSSSSSYSDYYDDIEVDMDPEKMLKPGDPNTFQAKIRKAMPVGYWVTMPSGREAFLPAQDLGFLGGLEKLRQIFQPGQEITVRVVTRGGSGREILSLKKPDPNKPDPPPRPLRKDFDSSSSARSRRRPPPPPPPPPPAAAAGGSYSSSP